LQCKNAKNKIIRTKIQENFDTSVDEMKNPSSLHLFILAIEPSKDPRVILMMNFYESINKHVEGL